MLTLYTWGTTNGRKPIIALEELRLAYELRPVDIAHKAQRAPAFLKMNPLGKIPVLEDPDVGFLTESNAILFHLATTTGRRIRPWPLAGAFLQDPGPTQAQLSSALIARDRA